MRFVLLAVVIAGLTGGCSLFPHKQKSATHIISGDASSTRIEETQAAGGPMVTY